MPIMLSSDSSCGTVRVNARASTIGVTFASLGHHPVAHGVAQLSYLIIVSVRQTNRAYCSPAQWIVQIPFRSEDGFIKLDQGDVIQRVAV